MASASNSMAPASPTDLGTIQEVAFGREQTASPEPFDTGPPQTYGSSTGVKDFEAEPHDRSPTSPDLPLERQRKSGLNHPQSSDHAAANISATRFVTWSSHSRNPISQSINSQKRSGDDEILHSPPSRQSTNITNASAPLEETVVWDHKAVLSLDGGGIRGYSSLLILREIMRAIGKLESEHEFPAESSFHPLAPASNLPTDTASASSKTLCDTPRTDSSPWLPCHYFDYIAGTSTGGLISIMLGRLRMNVDDCIRDYEQFGEKVFGHPRLFHLRSPLFWVRDKYDHKILEKVIKEVIENRVPHVPNFPGGRNFAFDENRCRTVVLSYQNQKTQGVEKTYLFRTYKNLHKGANHNERLLDRNPGLAHDVPIWKVARATSSAPTYFQTTKINGHEYLDGGFGANNPCIEIYDEVRKMNNNSEDFGSIILSIGTGKNGAKRLTGVNGLSRYLNYLNFAKKWATDSEGTHNAMLKKIERGDIKFPYYRFNLEDGLGAMKLDEWRVRGPLRTKFGKIIGNMRSPGKRVSISGHSHMGEKCPDWGLSKEMNDESSNLQASAAESTVPKWLQPKNETLESITEYTEKYLAQDQVQEMIQKTAEILVKNRRDRVGSNEQRWKKACFGAWYQCNIERCQRAETEYKDREALKRHLLDKHRDRFSKNPQEQEKLEKALDMCEVVVH